MAVWSAVCRLIRIPLIKLPQVHCVVGSIAMETIQTADVCNLGVCSLLPHSRVGLKLKSVVVLNKGPAAICISGLYFHVDQVLRNLLNLLCHSPELNINSLKINFLCFWARDWAAGLLHIHYNYKKRTSRHRVYCDVHTQSVL